MKLNPIGSPWCTLQLYFWFHQDWINRWAGIPERSSRGSRAISWQQQYLLHLRLNASSDRIRLKRSCVERPLSYRIGFSRFEFVEEVAELSANDGGRSRGFNDATDRVSPFCRQFADKHLLRSERTQKMSDSPFKRLSNGIRMNEIR